MAKNDRTIYVCGECGYESGKWLGHCPACSAWNTMVAFTPSPISSSASSAVGAKASGVLLSNIKSETVPRILTGIGELDRVLGGGIVLGSCILLGGDPGIGKSTLLMQAAGNIASTCKVLYVSGEESAAQLKLRADRLHVTADMMILSDTLLTDIDTQIESYKPDILIVDSIQTIYNPDIASTAGSVTQIRECTARFMRYAKAYGISVFIVGHVTKEGALAGPRMLEHMVDTVLYFEGDRHDSLRLLRAVKNRFGSTNEIGVFEMRDVGMAQITDPSELFLSGSHLPGCAVTCVMEGTRPMLAEVQALLVRSQFANPRRFATGLDTGRLGLLLAVLEKKTSLSLSDMDIYANVVGGLRIAERACDLAVVLCVASAISGKPLPKSTAVIGEVSLTGELRRVSRTDKRISECERLGYKRIIVPFDDYPKSGDIQLLKVKTIAEAAALVGIV
ncbi:MAG: DNA repair protein RadA [Clostridiales bacterium]|nr:DNA repair protein RadA [Clostridiales bacterium]MDD7550462.1 DNA repair protein RadA [Clostridia bacterium]